MACFVAGDETKERRTLETILMSLKGLGVSPPPANSAEGKTAVNAATSPGPVLIIDDDPQLAASLKDAVEGLGYRAVCAPNGREALDRIKERRPSLLLVDLFMPVMGGIEFLHVIRDDARLSTIPKVIMTAANDRMVGVKEDVSVLYKPFELDVLVHLLEQYCRKG
jgi:CheY-like chemotaxis protein